MSTTRPSKKRCDCQRQRGGGLAPSLWGRFLPSLPPEWRCSSIPAHFVKTPQSSRNGLCHNAQPLSEQLQKRDKKTRETAIRTKRKMRWGLGFNLGPMSRGATRRRSSTIFLPASHSGVVQLDQRRQIQFIVQNARDEKRSERSKMSRRKPRRDNETGIEQRVVTRQA